jgi:SAM-dependent methyltransferase
VSEPIRLNLGSGAVELPGYVNLDIKRGQRAYPLAEYADCSIDEVRASHLLEHFGHPASMAVLSEWIRVLKVGGLLRLAVPDFEWCAREYIKGIDRPDEPANEGDILGYVMGGWTDEHDRHGAMFDELGLRAALTELGMVDVERWDGDARDCSGLPVSLNLQARKPTEIAGRLEMGEVTLQAPAGVRERPYDWLRHHARNVYSQTGEDGLIAAVFEKIGTANRWAFECGAGDGTLCCNTRALVEHGWTTVLVEADPEVYARLESSCAEWTGGTVFCRQATALSEGDTSLEALLRDAGAPAELDLLVLDVDGQEWHLWNSLLHYRPRVVLVEYDPSAPAEFVPTRGGEGQAGRDAILRLAAAKGYEVLGLTPYNVLCVRKTLADMLAWAETAETEAARPAPVAEANASLPSIVLTEQPAATPTSIDPEMARRVRALLTVPRFMPTETVLAIERSLVPLGVGVEYALGVFWGQCLSRLMRMKIAQGVELLLTVDYDTVFCASDVVALYRLMDAHPEVDALVPLQMKRASRAPLFHLADEHGECRREVPWAELRNEVVPIRAGHFGLTMLRASALERMPHPWFIPVPDPATGEWDDGRIDEDVNFWLRWREAGNTVALASQVVLGHIEEVITWPDTMLRPMYQHVREYQTQGRPRGVWR